MSSLVKRGTPWSLAEVEQLETMLSGQFKSLEIANQLGRTEKAVKSKIYAIRRQRNRPKSGRQQRRHNGASFFLS